MGRGPLAPGRDQIDSFSGPYDDRPAIVSIHAGAGGTDSHDWTDMLLRMYLRWAETQKRPVQVMDLSYGEEAGLRSATLEIGGDYACGYMAAEHGVHRLVRLSPFDPNHLRHTSFSVVEVLPVAEEDSEITVRPEDIKLEFFPRQRPRRPKCAESCLRGAANPPAHIRGGHLSKRAFSASEPGVCHANLDGQAPRPAKPGT